MKRINQSALIFGQWVIILLFALFVAGCDPTDQQSVTPGDALSKVSIGIQVSPAMTLVMVAKDKDFFTEEGLDVEIKEFTAGKFALQSFLSGAIDYAVSGEVPVALATLQGNPIRVVAQVVEKTTNEVRVVARRDGDISEPTEYFKARKRKLATSFGGGPEFFTYSFLNHYGIDSDEVVIISQKPEDMPAALQTGSVDAIAIFDPFAFIAESRMGKQAITFADDALYSEFYVLDALPDQIENNAAEIKAILRALKKAGDFIEQDPETSKQILQRYTKLDRDIIDGVWGNFIFRPALTQTLLDYWNAQAAWAKDVGKVTPNTEIPDYNAVLAPQFLMEVDPDAVKLGGN
jgi:NitT/TauT family transport system substrate-binding protein